jgi:beta-phosphoglucomutase-like phosphatase (HAD superfamily)
MLTPPASAKALIFDCDGTLAITRDMHYAALRAGFAELGLSLDSDEGLEAAHAATMTAIDVRLLNAAYSAISTATVPSRP